MNIVNGRTWDLVLVLVLSYCSLNIANTIRDCGYNAWLSIRDIQTATMNNSKSKHTISVYAVTYIGLLSSWYIKKTPRLQFQITQETQTRPVARLDARLSGIYFRDVTLLSSSFSDLVHCLKKGITFTYRASQSK